MKMLLLGSAAAAMTLAASPAAATYLPVGVQSNVALSTVTDGGWILCYQATMKTSIGHSALDELATCGASGKNVMLAGRLTGSDTLLLLAQASYTDVTFDTGSNSDVVHTANGAEWYYHDAQSWGFAGLGDAVNKNICDTNSGADRMCVHLVDNFGGFRIGTATGLNTSTAYEKLIFVFDPAAAVPEPASWAMMLGGFGMVGAAMRKRKTTVRFA